MREWALLWRKSRNPQDLRIAISMRASWRGWKRSDERVAKC